MADEPTEGTPKKSSFIMTALLLVGALLVPAIVALVIAKMWVLPRLTGEEVVEAAPVVDDDFPATMTLVEFPKINVSVASDDPDMVPPLLSVQVTLSCVDDITAAKVEEKKAYFAAEILRLHQGRTRAELNDPLVQSSILEQIKQQSNILLKRMAPDMDLKVLRAMHTDFMIVDL